MNIYKYLEKVIDKSKIQDFKGDLYELALVRYILMMTSKIFYRDITFFLNDEQIKQRRFIYSKRINPENIISGEIVCSSYCALLKEVMEKIYNIKSELVQTDNDVFKHIALLIITKQGNRYFIDPLMDLSEMKVGMKTNNFAEKEKSNNPYLRVKIDNLSFLPTEELREIDKKIGYLINDKYMEDNFLESNDIITFLEQKRIEIKGIVELIIYIKNVLKIVSKNENFDVWDFFIDDINLMDQNIEEVLNSNENRKRGIVIEYKDKFIILSENSKKYLIMNNEQWNKKIKENAIFVRKRMNITLYKYLNELELEPNILDHRVFQRVIYEFERDIIAQGKEPKDYIEIINRNKVILNNNGKRKIYIENDLLTIFDEISNKKIAVIYEDEGRNIEYRVI